MPLLVGLPSSLLAVLCYGTVMIQYALALPTNFESAGSSLPYVPAVSASWMQASDLTLYALGGEWYRHFHLAPLDSATARRISDIYGDGVDKSFDDNGLSEIERVKNAVQNLKIPATFNAIPYPQASYKFRASYFDYRPLDVHNSLEKPHNPADPPIQVPDPASTLTLLLLGFLCVAGLKRWLLTR